MIEGQPFTLNSSAGGWGVHNAGLRKMEFEGIDEVNAKLKI